MKAVRFYTCQDWRRPHRRWKVIGFIIPRLPVDANKTIINKIFGWIHNRASHHGKTMHFRWKHAENRLTARYKRRL